MFILCLSALEFKCSGAMAERTNFITILLPDSYSDLIMCYNGK